MNDLAVRPETPIREVIGRIEASGRDFALVVAQDGRLEAFITDGDIRHAIAAGVPLDAPIDRAVRRRPPTTAPAGTPDAEALAILRRRRIRHLPLLDEAGRVVRVATLEELAGGLAGIEAVVMAGGEGRRLRPLTETVPKPLVEVAGKAVLDHVIESLAAAGVGRVHVATRHLADRIEAHVGDGARYGLEVRCVREDSPRGTMGALALLPPPARTVLVANGDVLARIDFAAMVARHRAERAVATVAVREYEIEVPFGVTEHDGRRVTAFHEKPETTVHVNAGVYLLEPEAVAIIPRDGRPYDATDLLKDLLARKDADRPVAVFPIGEWIDVGTHETLARARETWAKA